MSEVKWGKFRIGDLFEIHKIHGFNKEKLITDSGNQDYDYITRTSFNQGIYCTTDYIGDNGLNEPNTFSLGLLQMDFFYRERPWYAGQFVRKIVPKFELTHKLALYFQTILNKLSEDLLSVLVRNIDDRFRESLIILPVTSSGDPDFSYMEERISELEEERISELEAYLKATGLNDYELTDEDKKILNEMENGEKEFGEFRIGDLFNSVNGDTDLKKSDLEMSGIPIITAGLNNSGILGKTNKKAKIISENTITIDMFGYPFYRDFQYKMVTHARVFALIPKFQMTKRTGLYITSSLHFLKDKFSYNDMCSWTKIQNLRIFLPVTSSSTPDYEWIERYIRAMEKEVIGKLYKYRGKEIDAAKEIVQQTEK